MEQMPSANYRGDISALRAAAVLAVIVFHFWKDALPGGFLGVDVFFVISGFVITKSLQRDADLKRFYLKRLRRIYPPLIMMIALTALIIAMVRPDNTTTAALAALFGVSNIFFMLLARGYHSATSDIDPFTHTWSLGVEEQYYVFYPLIFFYLLRHRQVPALVAMGAISLAVFIIDHGQPSAFYLLHARFWELAAGCLIAIRPIRLLPPVVAWPALFAAFLFPPELALMPTMVAVAATASLIVARQTYSVPRSIEWIGLASYSLYLWHWPLLVLARWTIGDGLHVLPLLVAGTLTMGYLSHRYVEGRLTKTTWTPALFAICLLVLTAVTVRPPFLADRKLTPSALGRQQMIDMGPVSECRLNPDMMRGPDLERHISPCLGMTGPKVVLVGDSFSGNARYHLAYAAKAHGFAFGNVWHQGCPLGLDMRPDNCADPQSFNGYLNNAIGAGDFVVLRLHLERYSDDVSGLDKEIAGLKSAVEAKGAKFLLIGSNPVLDVGQVGVLTPAWFNGFGTGRHHAAPAKEAEFAAFDRHLATRFGSSYFSLAPYFVDDGGHWLIADGGTGFYFDMAHLNREGFDRLGNAFSDRIEASIERESSDKSYR